MNRTDSGEPDERQGYTDCNVVLLRPSPVSRSVMIEVQRNTSHEGRLPEVEARRNNTSLARKDS